MNALSKTIFKKHWPLLFVALYWPLIYFLGGLRSDHFVTGAVIILLWYTGIWPRRILKFLAPLLLTGILYDSQRFYSDYIRGPIHVTEPYRFDKYFFGIHSAGNVLTPNEWFQLHTLPFLDIVTGFFYLTFIAIFILISAYFQFWLTKKGTSKFKPDEMKSQAPRVMWSFFWVNMLGYTTYYWYAAAPPWYVALYGLGPARMDVGPNSAGCIRFDQALGTHFFSEMYGRSADVFGAIPSLHVAYPFLAMVYAFRFRSLRAFSTFFYMIMCFSAVYLNHHYILDIIWGTAYSIIIMKLVDLWYERRYERHKLAA